MATTTIYNELIAVNAVSGTAIADNAVTSVHIAQNNVGTVQLALNSVTSVSIALNQVTGTQIANNAITSTQLADNAVTATKVPDGTQFTLGATTLTGALTGTTGAFVKASSGGSATAGTVLTIEDDDNTELSLLGGSSSLLAINFGHSGDVDDGMITYNTTSGSEAMNFTVDGGVDALYLSAGDVVFNNGSVDMNFRVESNGNANMLFVDGGNDRVGIGTASPDGTLHLKSSADTYLYQEAGSSDGNAGILFQNNSGQTRGYVIYDTDDDLLLFQVNQSERMRIDSSGRVGINRTPALTSSKLEVGGADNYPLINVEASGNTAGIGIGSGHFQFYTGTTERWRIESGGKFYGTGQIQGGTVLMGGANITYDSVAYSPIGTNSTGASIGIFRDFSASYPTLIWDTADNAHFAPHDSDMRVYLGSQGGKFGGNSSNNLRPVGTSFFLNSGGANFVFERAGTGVGYVDAGGFEDGSDIALKKDVADLTYGLDTVKLLKPRKFKWKSNSEDAIGFIAQEVESIIPEVVSESCPSGEVTSFKGMSYGHLTAVLVKAMQELEARVKELEG